MCCGWGPYVQLLIEPVAKIMVLNQQGLIDVMAKIGSNLRLKMLRASVTTFFKKAAFRYDPKWSQNIAAIIGV